MAKQHGSIPLFNTYTWPEVVISTDSDGGLSLRVSSKEKDILLFNSSACGVFKYNSKLKTLEAAPKQMWDDQSSPIASFDDPPNANEFNIFYDHLKNKIMVGGKELNSVKGKVHLTFKLAPSGKEFAVLSAAGGGGAGLLPFIGSGAGSGKHYHQLFSYPDLLPIGDPVELPFKAWKGRYNSNYVICWSPDEKHIIYSDVIHAILCVIDKN